MGSPRILVTYTTNAGSTKEVAERIASNIRPAEGVDVLPVGQVEDVAGYAGVVIGGPMILGWDRKARKFYRRHRAELAGLPVHVFMTAMRVTGAGDTGGVVIDPGITVSPANPDRLSRKEKLTTVGHYLRPFTGKGAPEQPSSIAIFGGKLDYTKLKLIEMLFVMLVIGESPGDKRNWELIEKWAHNLQFRSRT